MSYNNSTPKTSIRRKDLVCTCCLFCVKFRCHGNGG